MEIMNIYEEWGFRQSPFSTTSLGANQEGEVLLVGREKEITSLLRKIFSPPKIPTIEGLNGVGKTSLVNVAAYKAFKACLSEGKGPLFIPCRKSFQINTEKSIDDFVDEVLMEVAQTLIERAEEVKSKGVKLQTKALNKWLNSPQISTYQGGAWVVQFGENAETNTSAGFQRSGFRKEVLTWLSNIFPTEKDGGVVCVIDNLELLESSEKAKQILEKLRDELLTITGLRWVLCGALGIVLGVVASPRLDGYVHRPIEVVGISDTLATSILKSRIDVYKAKEDPYLPITDTSFVQLYEVLKGNLRSVISYADDYCQWVADQDLPNNDLEKNETFKQWLNEIANSARQAFNSQIRKRALEVFQTAATDYNGLFSPSDYEGFGFNSIAAFRPHIRDLEAAGVLVSTKDEGDKRRKTIQITPKGWLVIETF